MKFCCVLSFPQCILACLYKKSKDHSVCSPVHPDLFPKQIYCSPKVETHPALHVSSGWVAVPCLSSPLTYQTPCTHAHLFIAVFLICRHGVGFGKLPSYIPFIPADIQLLVANQALLTPSVSEELTL